MVGAHGGPGEFFSQLARQCYMGNSCNLEHEEEIEEDTINCTRRRGRCLTKYILGRVSVITVISSYLGFKGYSAVAD